MSPEEFLPNGAERAPEAQGSEMPPMPPPPPPPPAPASVPAPDAPAPAEAPGSAPDSGLPQDAPTAPQPQPYQPHPQPPAPIPGGYAEAYPGQPQAPYAGGYPPEGYIPAPQLRVKVTESIEVVPVDDVNITTGFNYAWKKFRQNMGLLILVALTYVGIALGLFLVVFGLFAAAASMRSGAMTALVFLLMIAAIITYPAVAQANILRGILLILEGRQVQFSSFFQFKHVGKMLLAWLLIAGASFLLGFTMVGPAVVTFVTGFTYWLIVDKDYGPWLAIVTSMKLVWNNIATVVVFLLATIIAMWVGMLFFGIGMFFAIPVVMIAQGWLYKTVIGEPVAE